MKTLILFLSVISAGLLAFSYTNGWHRASDSLSMLRPFLALGCGLVLATTLPLILRCLLTLVACAVLAHFYTSFPHAQAEDDLRLYSKNVRYDNGMVDAIVTDIKDAEVDVVMLQEITETNQAIMDNLIDDFPFQHLRETASRGDVALLSKHPFLEKPECTQRRSLLAARLVIDGKPVSVVSVHIPWPWPAKNFAAEQQTWQLLAKIKGPVVLAGDFNSFAWSQRLSRVQTMTNTLPAGPLVMTLDHKKLPIPMPLDYALAPGGGRVDARTTLGSDHLGIVATVSLTPSQ